MISECRSGGVEVEGMNKNAARARYYFRLKNLPSFPY